MRPRQTLFLILLLFCIPFIQAATITFSNSPVVTSLASQNVQLLNAGDVQVAADAVNHAPVWSFGSRMTFYLAENELFSKDLQPLASDPDAQDVVLLFDASELPPGASLDTSVLRWLPGYDQAGSYTSTVTVSDGRGESAEAKILFEVADRNRPPSLSVMGETHIRQVEPLMLQLVGEDPDPENTGFVYEAIPLPSWMILEPDTGILKNRTDPVPGVYPITFSVTDSQGSTVFKVVVITVDEQLPYSVRIIPARRNAPAVGETFSVDVTIDAVEDLYGFQFDLRFNEKALRVLDVQEGPFLNRDGVRTDFAIQAGVFNDTGFVRGVTNTRVRDVRFDVDPETGKLVEVVVKPESLEGMDGSGTLAIVAFEMLDNLQECILELQKLKLYSSHTELPAQSFSAVIVPRTPIQEVVDTSPPSPVSIAQPEEWILDANPQIHWEASVDAESGVVDYEYVVDGTLNNQADGPWTAIGMVTTGLTITPALDDGKYEVWLRAKNSVGLYSQPARVIVQVDATPPQPVTELTAESVDGTRILLTWEPSTASDAAQYHIYWDNAQGTVDYQTRLAILPHPAHTWTSAPLTEGERYTFGIRTEDQAGNLEQNTSIQISMLVNKPPMPVSDLRAQPISGGRVRLTWRASPSTDVSQYHVYTDDGTGTIDHTQIIGSVLAPTTSWSSDSLTHDVTYRFIVRAMDTEGVEDVSLPIVASATVDGIAPDPPTDFTGESLPEAIVRLAWTPSASSDVVQYYIYWDNGTGKVDYANPIADVAHPEATWESGQLTDGTTYTFALRAIDSAGNISQDTAALVSLLAVNNQLPKIESLSSVLGTQTGDIRITYMLSDRESDTLNLVCEYSVDAGNSWRRATIDGLIEGLSNYQYYGILTWRSRADIPSTQGTDVRLRFTLSDTRAGEPVQTRTFRLVNLLADYDDDRDVDFEDLELFTSVWRQNDLRCDIGPATGTPPDLLPTFDGKLDFEDLAVFILMWNWSYRNVQVAPVMEPVTGGDRQQIVGFDVLKEISGQQLVILALTQPPELQVARLVFTFDPDALRVAQASPGNLWRGSAPLFLNYVDNERGVVEVQIARLGERQKGPDERPKSPTNRDVLASLQFEPLSANDVAVQVIYELRDDLGRVITQGRQTVSWHASPNTTRLLPNYPNPFNPETWIPYQLAEDASVTIQIDSANGRKVRMLELGHKRAGWYGGKEEAAYWDGRNDWGEIVASGVYFYTMRTGTFTATKRLVVVR